MFHKPVHIMLIVFHAVSPADYKAMDVMLAFEPCDTQQCQNMSITDDLINEPEERFNVSVSLTSPDNISSFITLGPVAGDIVITDDDGKYLLYSGMVVKCTAS